MHRFCTLLSTVAAATLMLAACSTSPATETKPVSPAPVAQSAPPNPFDQASTLPFEAPPFDKIKDSDFQPAMDEGMKRELADIETIANNPAPATFENTIVAMEKSGQMLDRVELVFNALAGANTDDALQKVQEIEAPKLAAHHDAIYLNSKLFERVKAVYDQRDKLNLDPEALQLVKVYYQEFVHAGAQLSDADKTKLRAINEQLSTLETSFMNKLLAGTKAGAMVVDDKSKLAGMSAGAIDAAAQAAKSRGLKGKWVISLQNTTQQPALQSLNNREVRKELFEDSWTRTEKGDANDTCDTIATIAKLRAEKAALMGYPNYAAYVLYDQMAKTPAAVETFLGKLVPAATAKARAEAKAIQAVIYKDGQKFKLEPWDWNYYAEQVRKAKYDLDESQIKPYFELNNVLESGVFYAANQLYGLTFKERKDIPVYQPDVRVFEVYDKDGSALGLMYFDYFKRDNKSGGAWMDNFVGQSKLLGTKPVIYNVANFTKPAPGQPALLTFDDVTTMFHEFGHALHGLFADEEYPTLSGTNVARDFVEFPSQFNEHWALYPKVFKHYAVDYKTSKPMPKALVSKIMKAAKFNQGYALTELLAAAQLDMQWHTLPASAPKQDVDKFEIQALKNTHLNLADVPPRYRSSYFLHIWANGYAAGYYAYLWTEMLDDDAYQWFLKHGGMTRENGQRFRDLILSRGHTEDYGPMFHSFYGKAPEIGPMLEHRGLK
ncbi:MAG: peptidyl-dipeptidase Dcp [Alphaproteobacteria bacterium]|nr:peptidyl-dipeptidase Dcp [Alphaproteobacteria bacterium]MDE2110548.1 peptidyl-dipeptidase Dcp [Alphaproteobacteria bacterium]MDE2492724.1 peptidyl-dipeptidase Dcp [Alphaproteobacteria bacterium]